MDIKPLDDVMSYYQFSFLAYLILFIIICVNFFIALYIKKNSPQYNLIVALVQKVNLIIDVLCGIAMAGGLIFQGVLADNNALGHNNWFVGLLGISILSFIIFVLNVIIVLKKRN